MQEEQTHGTLGLLMSKPTRVAQYAKPLLAAIPQFDYKREPLSQI